MLFLPILSSDEPCYPRSLDVYHSVSHKACFLASICRKLLWYSLPLGPPLWCRHVSFTAAHAALVNALPCQYVIEGLELTFPSSLPKLLGVTAALRIIPGKNYSSQSRESTAEQYLNVTDWGLLRIVGQCLPSRERSAGGSLAQVFFPQIWAGIVFT